MDLGHNQQQHPTVHSGGVSRVPCRSPAPPLLLIFRSPSAHLPLPFRFLWTLFVDTFCGHFFVDFLFFVCSVFVCVFACVISLHSFLTPKRRRKEKKKKKKCAFCPFLSVLVSLLLSALVKRFSVSCMRDFF